MVSREDVTTERQRNDDKHQHLFVVLDGLEDDELAVEEGEAVLADVVAVGIVEGRDVRLRKRRGRGQTVEQDFGIGVLLIGGGPVEGRGNRARAGDSIDEGAGDEFGRRVGSVDRSEEVDVNEMVDEVRTETEGATGRERESIIGWGSVERKGSDNRRGSRVARE